MTSVKISVIIPHERSKTNKTEDFLTMNDDFRTFVVKAMSVYLIGMGIYPNAVSFSHLTESVYIAAKNGVTGISICNLYAEVGRGVKKSGVAVERAIRNVLNKCIDEGRMYKLNEYFGYTVYSDKFPIRAGELICLLATKILDDYTALKAK